MFGSRQTVLIVFLYLTFDTSALKCRTGDETQPNEDFEYVVRMCLRQMKNASRQESFDRNLQNMFEMDRSHQQDRNKNFGGRGGDGFEHFMAPNGNENQGRDKDRKQDKMDNDYMEDTDYFHYSTAREMSHDSRKIRPRPHSYQQQAQHDAFGYGHRDRPTYSFQNTERYQGTKWTSNRKGESPLEQLDPCMIHCIFQEMQMLDESGKPDKRTVVEKMSQKIRNPELKSFIQDSVDECFDIIDYEASNNRGRGSDFMCVWAKNFAICLEEKGKESCDDWNDPISKSSKGRGEQKNENKGGKNRG